LLVEFVVFDAYSANVYAKLTLVNLDNVLPDDAPGANVKVTDLRVAHQPVLETDSEAMRFKLDKVVLVADGVHVGRVAVVDGIALFLGRDAPAIVYARVSGTGGYLT
jgi:hypothetical protein